MPRARHERGTSAWQVALAKSKKSANTYAALKVVFLQNPELDAEHVELMRRWGCRDSLLDSWCCQVDGAYLLDQNNVTDMFTFECERGLYECKG